MTVVVERVRVPGLPGSRQEKPDYASKPGDAHRQGRTASPVRGVGQIVISFTERSGVMSARLGVIELASITHDPDSREGYCCSVLLPGYSPKPQPARDLDAARRA